MHAVCKLAEGIYILDIPYGFYERGACFSWTKIPDVQFDASYLTWYRVSGDPEGYERYIEY